MFGLSFVNHALVGLANVPMCNAADGIGGLTSKRANESNSYLNLIKVPMNRIDGFTSKRDNE